MGYIGSTESGVALTHHGTTVPQKLNHAFRFFFTPFAAVALDGQHSYHAFARRAVVVVFSKQLFSELLRPLCAYALVVIARLKQYGTAR